MTNNQYLINIHTTGETAFVNLSKKDHVLGTVYNHDFKTHAKFLHPAIDDLLKENNIAPIDLSAICVTDGPGSYTGIRVGLAAAKGFCYALKIPLITHNTLDVLAKSAIQKINDSWSLYSPMIDARRMEVYTGVYNFQNKRLLEPQALILEASFAEDFTRNKNVYFFGSGSMKFHSHIENELSNYSFADIDISPEAMAGMSYIRFLARDFSDLAYSEPNYLKDFVSTTKK